MWGRGINFPVLNILSWHFAGEDCSFTLRLNLNFWDDQGHLNRYPPKWTFPLSPSFQFLEFSFCKQQKTELYLKFVIGWDCHSAIMWPPWCFLQKFVVLAYGYYYFWFGSYRSFFGGEGSCGTWYFFVLFFICTSPHPFPWMGGGGGGLTCELDIEKVIIIHELFSKSWVAGSREIGPMAGVSMSYMSLRWPIKIDDNVRHPLQYNILALFPLLWRSLTNEK